MKTSVISIIFVCISLLGFSQNDEFSNVMNENIAKFQTAQNQQDFQTIANQFERISNSEKTKWEPLYYTAFCYVNMAFSEKEGSKIDQLLDNADIIIKKAMAIDSTESEIYTLQGMSFQARISVSPMKRGQEFSQKANEQFSKAKIYNAENPRIYFLVAQNLYNTPKFFGGGSEKALPYFEKAKEKFDSFTPKNSYSPKWGKSSNEKMLENCKKG